MSEDEPIYNIGVMARMTGIPAATLRVWERRYDFPDVARTQGGHRLYSDRDVRYLRWIKEKIDAGMQTRQAIRALKALRAEEMLTGESIVGDSTGYQEMRSDVSDVGKVQADSYIELLRTRLMDALLARNLVRADEVVSESLGHYSPEDVMLRMMRPVLADMGEGWSRDEIGVGTEHFVTNYLRQHLARWLRTGPPLYQVPPTVLACAPGEYHEGSLMIFGALLRRRRWPVAYLGQSIPLPDLAQFVKQAAPLAVVVVAMMEEAAAALAEWPDRMPEVASNEVPVFAYAGRIFNEKPEWRARVKGLFLGVELGAGVETMERILRNAALRGSVPTAGSGDQDVRQA